MNRLGDSPQRLPWWIRTPKLSLRRSVWIAIVWAVLVAAAAAPSARQSPSQPAHDAQAAEEHAPEAGGLMKTVAKLFNFALLVGVLVYFLKTPIAGYLETRGAGIRAGLVAAATVRETATAQLAEIQRKMQSLPGELDALRARGAEDLRAEQARIAEAARAERDRVLEQTRREIAMRLGIAKRQLTEDAAELAVRVAEQRIRRSITSEDQLRLVDRYAAQLKEAAR